MRVDFNSNQSFMSGNVFLNRVTENTVVSKNILEIIAKKNDVDLWVSKAKNSKYLPKNDMYTITAHQDLKVPPYIKRGVAVTLTDKTADEKTVTEKIFGAIFQAIANLKNKI